MLINNVRTFWGAFAGLFRLPGMQTGLPGNSSTPAANVTFDKALSLSVWWAGVKLLAETVASLPMCMYLNGKESDMHPLWYLFNVKPNRYQTSLEFFETMMLNLVTSGNAYAAIERVGDRVVSLLPLMSSQVTTDLLPDGSVIHTYYDGRNIRIYSAQNMWHVKLMGNGIVGLSPMAYARNSLGIAIAADNRVSAIMRNGGKPTGVLMIDKVLSKEQRSAVRDGMKELALGNSDNLYVLEAGMKYQQVSMSPEDMELVATRKFQLSDLARFLGVPSVLLNDTESSTAWGSGIDSIIQGFQKLNLRPILERFERSAQANLLISTEQRQWYFEFNYDALLRMDKLARYDSLNKAVNGGILTPNEARAQEGLSDKPGGDVLLVNSTLVPIDQVRVKPNTQEIPNGNRNQAADR